MSTMILIDQQGPLPLNATFQSPLEGTVTFVLTGTAWTQSAPTMTGIQLLLDGVPIGKPALCFANNNASHQAMRTTFITVDNLTYDQHTITIEPSNTTTVTDFNDYYQVTMLF